jgi:hypothetical protein
MRLIDADELLKHEIEADSMGAMLVVGKGYILSAPTIDAAPVVRGEWLVTDAYPHRVYCSLCHKTNVPNEEYLFERNEYPKFCMWCGAKMEDGLKDGR